MSNDRSSVKAYSQRHHHINEFHFCKVCNLFTSYSTLDEHNALKHNIKQNDNNVVYKRKTRSELFSIMNQFRELSLNTNNSVDRIDSSVKSIGSYHKLEEIHINSVCSEVRTRRTYSNEFSGDKVKTMNNMLPRDARALIRRSDILTTEKKNRSSSEIRSNVHIGMIKQRRDLSLDGAQSRMTIPSVLKLFNLHQDKSDSNYTHLFRSGPSHVIRHSVVASKKPIIPEHFVKCQICLNVMHQDYFEGHLQRKHKDNMNGEPVNVVFQKCNICDKRMPKEYIDAHVERSHRNAENNKDNFIRCAICDSFMHIDFMRGHLLRKHYSYNGSIGIAWPQFNDDEISQWLNDGLVFVSNGAIYIQQCND